MFRALPTHWCGAMIGLTLWWWSGHQLSLRRGSKSEMQTSGCHDYMDPQRDPRGSEIPFLGMNYMKETTRQKVENCSLLMYTIVYVCYDRILMTHLAPSQVTWASCRKPLWWKGSLSLAQDRHGFNSLIALLRIALTISGGRDYYGIIHDHSTPWGNSVHALHLHESQASQAMDGLRSGLMFEAATSSAVMKPTIDAPKHAPQLWRDQWLGRGILLLPALQIIIIWYYMYV